MSTTILLGPQRFTTTVGAVVSSLDVPGRIAVVNAGWEERESDDGELNGLLDGRGANLRLHHRMMDVLTKDEHVAAAAIAFRDRQDELRAFYGIRLQSAVDVVHAVAHRTSRYGLGQHAVDAALAAVREVDRWYAAELADLYRSAWAAAPRDDSATIGWHRGEIGALLDECSAVVVAGGNVRTLLQTLHLFDVSLPAGKPVVAWSAGAMALTDTVVLFHDDTSHGVTAAEVHDTGLGRLPGLVVLPHAKRRLHLDDPSRMLVLARRFPGHRLALLDDGAVLRFDDGVTDLPDGARYVDDDGHVGVVGAA
jgi:hypothetical protein